MLSALIIPCGTFMVVAQSSGVRSTHSALFTCNQAHNLDVDKRHLFQELLVAAAFVYLPFVTWGGRARHQSDGNILRS